MIISSDGIRIYPSPSPAGLRLTPTPCEIAELERLEVINCPRWPSQHNEELARQVGRHLTRIIKRGGMPESARDAMHAALFTGRTWAAQRLIESGKIHAGTLGGKECEEWTQLTPAQKRRRTKLAREAVALHANLVGGKSGNKRCSPAARIERREQKQKHEEWAANNKVFNKETGQYFSLAAPEDKLKTRLAEFYTFAKGLEAIIKPNLGMPPDYEWARAIITAPAQMHCNPTKGSSSWDGTLPNEVARYFAEGWALVRARLAKFGITCSGFWTREAHQDATPHVNFFIIFRPGAYREVARAMKEVFGKNKRATNIMQGDDERARKALEAKGQKPQSFATYAMKYFSKGFQAEPDEDSEGEDVTASAFGYRRHGFFGLPSLTVWRELRRMQTCNSTDPLIKAAWFAAHRGDAADFIQLAGGLACARSCRPLQTLRQIVFKNKNIQVVTDEPAETPFEIKEETVTTKTSEVVGVRRVALDADGNPYTADAIRTRIPGIYEIISIEEAVVRDKTAQELIKLKEPKDKHKVTVILNDPRAEASPPPEPPITPPCTGREYRLTSG
jgi:hypothetical protein